MEVLELGLLQWRLVDVIHYLDNRLGDFAGRGILRDDRGCGGAEHIFARLTHLVRKAPVPQTPCSLTKFTAMALTYDSRLEDFAEEL